MVLTLKSCDLGTPLSLIEKSSNILASNVDNYNSRKLPVGEMINLEECLQTDFNYRIRNSRINVEFMCTNRGYFYVSGKVILLFIEKEGVRKVILNKEFTDNYTSLHTSIKKQLKALDIPKANWIYLNTNIIYREFQDLIVPDMLDYVQEVQDRNIEGFKEYMKEELECYDFYKEKYND
jgi:hypothetical protein